MLRYRKTPVSIATEDYTVSLGRQGFTRRLTNVSSGIDLSDAVNVYQMNAVQLEARRGIAAAAAAANAMMPSAPGKTTVSAGYGNFKSESAVGFNVSHWLRMNSENARVLFSAGAALGERSDDSLFRASVGVEF